jgi:hypothetical protein
MIGPPQQRDNASDHVTVANTTNYFSSHLMHESGGPEQPLPKKRTHAQ